MTVEIHGGYQIDTYIDPDNRKITSTITMQNPDGTLGEKLQVVTHKVMELQEKNIQKALKTLGWVSPEEFKKVAEIYQEEVERSAKKVASIQREVAELTDKLERMRTMQMSKDEHIKLLEDRIDSYKEQLGIPPEGR